MFVNSKYTCFNESNIVQWGMLQRTVFIHKIRILQRTQMLQRTLIFYAFIMESSIIVFTRARLFMLSCALDCLCSSNLRVQGIKVE